MVNHIQNMCIVSSEFSRILQAPLRATHPQEKAVSNVRAACAQVTDNLNGKIQAIRGNLRAISREKTGNTWGNQQFLGDMAVFSKFLGNIPDSLKFQGEMPDPGVEIGKYDGFHIWPKYFKSI